MRVCISFLNSHVLVKREQELHESWWELTRVNRREFVWEFSQLPYPGQTRTRVAWELMRVDKQEFIWEFSVSTLVSWSNENKIDNSLSVNESGLTFVKFHELTSEVPPRPGEFEELSLPNSKRPCLRCNDGVDVPDITFRPKSNPVSALALVRAMDSRLACFWFILNAFKASLANSRSRLMFDKDFDCSLSIAVNCCFSRWWER